VMAMDSALGEPDRVGALLDPFFPVRPHRFLLSPPPPFRRL
jgi:hypothetical protein